MSDSLKIAFYSGKGDNFLLAWFVEHLTGKFVHVELLFENEGNTFYSTSIEQGTCVYFKKKTYGRTNWEYLTITSIDKNKVAEMRNFAFSESQKNKQFDLNTMVRSITPFPKKNSKRKLNNKYFCSMYVCEVLKQGGFLDKYVSASVTPTSLYRILLKEFNKNQIYKSASPILENRLGQNKLLSII
jgi:hypothetical protein